MHSGTALRSGCLLLAVLAGAVQGAEIYRWVDEQGRTQISDRPPPGSAGSASKQATPTPTVSPDQRRAAEERAASDRARVDKLQRERLAAGTRAARPAAAASGPDEAGEGPLPPRASTEDCRLWRQEFSRSAACYAPYRTARGGIKPEAFEACGEEVLDPALECGALRYP